MNPIDVANSGSMPISASGGMAGPSAASAMSTFEGNRFGAINFGSSLPPWLPWIAVLGAGALWWMNQK